jgi:hypothetical protein
MGNGSAARRRRARRQVNMACVAAYACAQSTCAARQSCTVPAAVPRRRPRRHAVHMPTSSISQNSRQMRIPHHVYSCRYTFSASACSQVSVTGQVAARRSFRPPASINPARGGGSR